MTTAQRIREVVGKHCRLGDELARLTDDDSLYDAGMGSHASVNVMLALEAEFDVMFPDSMIRRAVFESISRLRQAIDELQAEETAKIASSR